METVSTPSPEELCLSLVSGGFGFPDQFTKVGLVSFPALDFHDGLIQSPSLRKNLPAYLWLGCPVAEKAVTGELWN